MMTTSQASTTLFPEARGREKGYDMNAVDDFMSRARDAFETSSSDFTAGDVRRVAFPLVHHGYSVAAVDAALGRIEDAFALREREEVLQSVGAQQWVGQTRRNAQVILDRLSRPRRRRFDRARGLSYGYRLDEVDLVADKIARYLQTGESVTAEQVRGVAFRMQRRGYREAQVDAVLDAVVEVILAVR